MAHLRRLAGFASAACNLRKIFASNLGTANSTWACSVLELGGIEHGRSAAALPLLRLWAPTESPARAYSTSSVSDSPAGTAEGHLVAGPPPHGLALPQYVHFKLLLQPQGEVVAVWALQVLTKVDPRDARCNIKVLLALKADTIQGQQYVDMSSHVTTHSLR